MKSGDKNTKYFHRTATAHKRFNSIDSSGDDGATISDPDSIKLKSQNYYQTLYKGTKTWRPDLNLQQIKGINERSRNGCKDSLKTKKFLNVSDYV